MSAALEEQRRIFEQNFLPLTTKAGNSFMSREKYDEVVSIVRGTTRPPTSHKPDKDGQYNNYKKKFMVVTLGGESVLAKKFERIDV